MATATRKCTGCKERYAQGTPSWRQTPRGHFHDEKCLNAYASRELKKITTKRKKTEQREWNERKKKLKGLTYWIKQTKLVAQEYAALRDSNKDCISCGIALEKVKDAHLTRFDGGHFKSVGAHPELQLDLRNIHGQCRSCNGFKGGMPVQFEQGLIDRYGQSFVDYLNSPKQAQNWTIGYLERYRKVIRKKTRSLIKRGK